MSNNGDDLEDRIVARINAHADNLFAMQKADADEWRIEFAVSLDRLREDLHEHKEDHS